jgi:hypothetical protein
MRDALADAAQSSRVMGAFTTAGPNAAGEHRPAHHIKNTP